MKLFNVLVFFVFLCLSFLHDEFSIAISFMFFHNIQNFLAVFVCTALMNVFIQKEKFRNAFGTALGLIIYEFIQLLLPESTFDWLDVLATLIGLFVYVVAIYLFTVTRQKRWVCKLFSPE